MSDGKFSYSTKATQAVQTPYHGPRVVFSRQEIERIHEVFTEELHGLDIDSSTDACILRKTHASLNADPAFTEPAK